MSKAFSFVVDGLAELGWEVEVVDVADRSPLRIGSSFSWARMKAIYASLTQMVERARHADVVYLTISQSRFGFVKDLLAIRWCALLGRSVVLHMHGGNFGGFYASLRGAEQALVKGALDRVAAIIVLTPSLKADFAMTRAWQERTVAISNTCDVAAGTARRLQPGKLRILYLSTLIASKGYREAIAAAGELARRQPDLRVTIDVAGALVPERDFSSRAAQAADLYRAVAALPANADAVFHGEVDAGRKEALLSAADVFVLPTRYINEGQPIAIIEALTAGLPVVATDWRGIRETLPPALHPLLVPTPDPHAMADRLGGLVTDPAWFEAASRAALDHAAAFRPERHLLAVDRVLREARDRALPGRRDGQHLTAEPGSVRCILGYSVSPSSWETRAMALVRINIGCGSSPTPGWLNLDNSATVRLAKYGRITRALEGLHLLNPAQAAFARKSESAVQWANASRRIPVADGGASVVYSSHMLEHLDRSHASTFLKEVLRVLAPGGILRLAVPDLEKLAAQYFADKDANRFVANTLLATAPQHSLLDRLKNLIVGPRHHLWMYDGGSLSHLLIDAGFVDVVVQEPGRTLIADPEPLDLHERAAESVFVEGRKP